MRQSEKSTPEKASTKSDVKKPDLTPEEESLALRAFYGGYYSAVKDIVNTLVLLSILVLGIALLTDKFLEEK